MKRKKKSSRRGATKAPKNTHLTKAYWKKWNAKHSERLRKQYKSRRDAWIEENGPCQYCGAWSNLVVDHIDPTKKSRPAGACWRMNPKNAALELAKCQVLCHDCHVEKSMEERKNPT